MAQTNMAPRRWWQGAITGLTANVLLVSLVSFLTDASSEMIFPLLPVFLALGSVGQGMAPSIIIGYLEGIAEATSAILKLVTGILTDRVKRKKPSILIGYGISSVVRPLMGFATAWWHPVFVRLADRIGKGIRSAPRDVLIAELTPREHRGKAFGFHRSMDHMGAVVGPLIAVALLFALAKPGFNDAAKDSLLRTIFLLAAIPGVFCLGVIIFGLRDVTAAPTGSRFHFAWGSFDKNLRYYLGCLILFTLGNSTDMFLILRASEVIKGAHGPFSQGIRAVAMIPLLWAFFHAFKMLATAPLGSLSDRVGRRNLIRLGWGIYALVYAGFAFMNQPWQAFPLFAIYALYYGLTEGVEKALVVDLAPKELRGTAMGMYHAAVGVAALPASLIFGFVYARVGALIAFGYAAVLALAAMVLLSTKVREAPKEQAA